MAIDVPQSCREFKTPQVEGDLKEDCMKTTYATPTMINIGNVVRETLSGKPGGAEAEGLNPTGGKIGFNL
jgi:hypothetical protein